MNGEPRNVILIQDITVFVSSDLLLPSLGKSFNENIVVLFLVSICLAFLPLLERKAFFGLFI